MGWLITVGILTALAVLPLGIRVRYNDRGLQAAVRIGPVSIGVYPLPKRKAKEEPPQKAAEKKPESEQTTSKSPESEGEPKQERGGSLLDFLPLVKLAFRFLGDLRRKLRVKTLQCKLILAGDDPCDLAVNYGRAWAALGNLIPQLERWFVIQHRDMEVACDFTAAQTLVIAHVEVTITLGRLLQLAAVYGFRGLKEFLNIRKKRKGGAVT